MAQKLRAQYPGAIYHVMNRRNRLFWEWGIPIDCPAGREQFAGQMEARRQAEGAVEFEPKGWRLGSEEFRHELLVRIAEAELAALGWSVEDLQRRRKSDPQKVRVAARLHHETTMTLGWIAARLFMDAPAHVASLLQRQEGKVQNSERTLF